MRWVPGHEWRAIRTCRPWKSTGGPAGYDADFWNALVALRGTPAAVIQRLNSAIAAALRTKDVQEKFYNIGFEPVSGTPEAAAELVHSDLKLFGDLIARTEITVQ